MKDKEQGRGGSTGANLSLECVKRGSQLVQSVTYTAHTGFQAGPNQTREKQQKHGHRPGILLHTNTSTGLVWAFL